MSVSTVSSKPSLIALIPARSGSKRVKRKNVRELNGHPLIAYTIAAAKASGVCSRVLVSTDSQDIADVAERYGAEVPFLRPAEFATDTSPDIEWLSHLLTTLRDSGELTEAFALLRPTSPFRLPETIARAWQTFTTAGDVDSLRAVEKCRQHPGKMWVIARDRSRMMPLLPSPTTAPAPMHSTPYQALPPVYIQNASLEIAWSRTVLDQRSIAGDTLVPFLTEGFEGFDVNDPEDWILAEHFVASGEAALPVIP